MKNFIVIGNPIEHSLSPLIHNIFAKNTNIKLNYQKALASEDNFNSTVIYFFNSGGVGANITAPFKPFAYNISQVKDTSVINSEAANTLYIKDALIYSYNTDGKGLLNDLKENNIPVKDSKILLIGAGGVVRTILDSLIHQSPHSISIINRSIDKIESIIKLWEKDFTIEKFDLDNQIEFDLVINTTSIADTSYFDRFLSKISVSKNSCFYDIVYAKDNKTPFLQWLHSSKGLKGIDGVGMLFEQAYEAFYIWHDVLPDKKICKSHFLNAIGR